MESGAGARGAAAGIALLAAAAAPAGVRAGTSACWFDKGALVAPAAFGDIAGDFVIDLSSAQSVLDQTRAQSDGIEAASVARPLRLAGLPARPRTFAIAPLDERTRRFDTVINGVIGWDVLGDYAVEVSLSPCRLRLSRRLAPAPAASARLKLTMRDGAPLIAARISDGVRVREGLFALDTSRADSLARGARLSRPPPPPGAQGEGPPVRLRAVEVAGRLFEQVPARAEAVAPAPGEARGAIGTAVWSAYRMRLDPRRGTLELWPAQTK